MNNSVEDALPGPVPAGSRPFVGADAVNRYQRSGRFHPFTCGSCRDNDAHLGPDGSLVAEFQLAAEETADGVVLVCPTDGCAYRQPMPERDVERIERMMAVPAGLFPWLSNPDGNVA